DHQRARPDPVDELAGTWRNQRRDQQHDGDAAEHPLARQIEIGGNGRAEDRDRREGGAPANQLRGTEARDGTEKGTANGIGDGRQLKLHARSVLMFREDRPGTRSYAWWHAGLYSLSPMSGQGSM